VTIAQPINPDFNFGQALNLLKKRCIMARRGWKGGGCINMHKPVAHSTLKVTTIYYYVNGGRVGVWIPKQADVLAEDWYDITGE
jgi:hypothetical protein